MILTGQEIVSALVREEIKIYPFNKSQLNPNSYDLRLGHHVLRYKDPVLDAKKELETESLTITEEGILLLPGELYLMATAETTSTYKHVPIIEGRSSIGQHPRNCWLWRHWIQRHMDFGSVRGSPSAHIRWHAILPNLFHESRRSNRPAGMVRRQVSGANVASGVKDLGGSP
jgi:hypothetical protein